MTGYIIEKCDICGSDKNEAMYFNAISKSGIIPQVCNICYKSQRLTQKTIKS